jgi:phosphoglycerol transferase MdoB-like AlkP superfamily enzyme
LGVAVIALFAIFNINGTINTIKAQELFTYHLVDIKNTITKDEKVEADGILTKADIEDLKSRASLKEGNLTGIGKGKNLIVLQVEAFQNFAVGLTYDGQEITPNINKLIEDKSSIYYNNYHQMIGRGNTSDAEFVSQNSLYPSMEEPTYTQYVNNTYYGLPWLLRDNGYNAWVFHGYKADYWNREEAYVNQGFQRFISEKDFTFDDIIGFGLKDEDFFDQSIHYLKELDKKDENPFYAFMITLSSHTPFLMPEEYQTLKIREEHKDTMLGNYLQAIHYTDKEIGRFIESLKKEGLYDDTVIAIYGDHFAVLSTDENEQPIMSDLLGERYDFDSMMNIPLIIHVPGEDIHKINSKLGSQLDFYPTIANIMGYNNEKGLVFGRDLNNTEENYVFPQTYMLKGSVITDTSVLEISRDGIFEHSRAYDRETRKEIDINQFKALSKKAEEEINKGHYILKHDTLKELK